MKLSNGSVSKQQQSSNTIVFSSSNTDHDGQACIDQINESAFLSYFPKERKKYKLCNTCLLTVQIKWHFFQSFKSVFSNLNFKSENQVASQWSS